MQLQILRRLLAPQNDSFQGSFHKFFGPALPSFAPYASGEALPQALGFCLRRGFLPSAYRLLSSLRKAPLPAAPPQTSQRREKSGLILLGAWRALGDNVDAYEF